MGRRIVTQRRQKLNSIATMLLEVIRTVSTQYQVAEKMLYSYPVNMMRLREAEERYEEIMSVTDCRAQRYDQPQHAIGTHSDPPNEYVVRLMSAEREIERYKKKTRIVDEVKDSLVNSDGEREQGQEDSHERTEQVNARCTCVRPSAERQEGQNVKGLLLFTSRSESPDVHIFRE